MTDTPDDALIEAIVAALLKAWGIGNPPSPEDYDAARAAYAAIVDHLGLEWQNSVKDMLAREPHPRRRLVSKWQEVQP